LSAVQDAMNAACVTAQCLEQQQTAVLVHGEKNISVHHVFKILTL